MTRTIAVAGAFDRFNYGDLLFPLVTRRALAALGHEAEISYHSLRAVDLGSRGGVATRELAELGRAVPEEETDSALVFAGGEILSARWLDAYLGLATPARSLAVKLGARVLGAGLLDSLSRRALGGRRAMPWLMTEAELSPSIRVAYNGVGGTEVGRLPEKLAAALRQRLAETAWLAVRDRRTKAALDAWDLQGPVRLTPDPATLIAAVLEAGELDRRLDPRVEELVTAGPGYAVFQVGRYPALGRVPALADQLREIYRQCQLPLVLAPLGQAPGHEDLHPLRRIMRQLADVPAVLLEAPDVDEIVALIAASRLFLGSSLHGNITAQAFAVPRVGFGRRVAKLDSYLRTWDATQAEGRAEIGALAARAAAALEIDRAHLEASRDAVVEAAWKGFSGMVAAISRSSPPRR